MSQSDTNQVLAVSVYPCLNDRVPDRLPLTTENLAAIGARVNRVPTYPRFPAPPGIVHVGVGGFHRAHMARYTDDLAHAGSPWRICGLGLLEGDRRMAEALAAQDHLYTLVERQSEETEVVVVGSITDYCLAADDHAIGARRVAQPEVEIVSFTITEGGYASGDDGSPPPALAMLVDGLDQRRRAGLAPVTVLSCDNLPGNGDVARGAVARAAAAASPEVARWIDEHCTFPNSMVDRITPATTDTDRVWLATTTGIDDRWPVVAESFRQWVIEDRFAAGRPRWEDAGALFTNDVHAWELYKLRMLNAAHSTMAYLSFLAGIDFVDEAVARPEVQHYLDVFLEQEAIPTLVEIPGHRREDYAASVLARFRNTGVRDQIRRLCIDGTAKFPIFLMPTIERQLALGGPLGAAALALAGWARYLALVPPAEQSFDAGIEGSRRQAVGALHDPVGFLDLHTVFPADVRNDARFRAAFVEAWEAIAGHGPLAAMLGV
jgi:mannitol 2-dehydrogenase